VRLLIATFLASAAVIAALIWPHHGALLDWDEVGYVNAARLGFIANYLEQGTLSYGDFHEFVNAKREKRAPVLPAGYEEERSPIIVRHIHPPFVAYVMSAFSSSGDDRVLRIPQLLGALALAAALIFAWWTISEKRTLAGALAIAFSATWAGVFLFSEISYHGWEAVFAVASAALLVRWLDDPSRNNLILLAAAIAFSGVALQTGAFVAFGAGIAVLAARRARKLPALIALVGLIFLILWPGSILTAALARIPAHYAYLFGRGDEYSVVGDKSSDVWRSIAPMLILLPFALAVLWRQRSVRRAIPFLAIGLVYTLAMTKVAIAPRYMIPGAIVFAPVIAYGFDRFEKPAAIVALAVFAIVWPIRPQPDHDAMLRRDLAWLGAKPARSAFIQGGHIYRHYLPEKAGEIRSITVDRGQLLLREAGRYRPLEQSEIDGALIGVKKKRERAVSSLPVEQLARCTKTELDMLEIYDCP
jgi:hypothetical protein